MLPCHKTKGSDAWHGCSSHSAWQVLLHVELIQDSLGVGEQWYLSGQIGSAREMPRLGLPHDKFETQPGALRRAATFLLKASMHGSRWLRPSRSVSRHPATTHLHQSAMCDRAWARRVDEASCNGRLPLYGRQTARRGVLGATVASWSALPFANHGQCAGYDRGGSV